MTNGAMTIETTDRPAPRWAQRASDASTGCYVHLPFCDRICPYCDFAVTGYADAKVERYLVALHREIERSQRPAHPVSSVYFGGGTPSTLGARPIAGLVAALARRFEWLPGSVECTIECNPSRNVDALPRWREAGVNRVSIGVQSFDDAELRRLGRDHTAAQAAEFVASARRAGFENVSIDLIAGVPRQTAASFARSLERALASDPDHVSVYALTIEEGTPYAVWQRKDPTAFCDDDLVASMLETAHATLAAAGFRHYEVSNFARPGFESAHNIGYWRQRDCLALGMSASGYAAGVRYKNVRGFDEYCRALEADRSPRDEEEQLDCAGRIGEAAMLALRTADGIDYADFRRRFSIDAARAFRTAIEECRRAGLLEEDGVRACLSARGRLLANEVCAEFLAPTLS